MGAGEPVRWIVSGGGTGGHVTPALALGEEIRRRGEPVLFLGGARGLETRLVPEAGFELVSLGASPVAGRSVLGQAGGALRLLAATRGAHRALAKFRADIVISVGGYASVPAALAALARRLPLVLVEPNAIPGRAHRLLARFARAVFLHFEAAADHLPPARRGARVEVVGVPLRRSLLEAFPAPPARRRPAPPFRLLVFGGSQGARQLNDALLEALPYLDPKAWHIVHQTGAADRERVAEAYRFAGFEAEVIVFESDFRERYRVADLAVCRAGALSVAELALAGLPALLVPYPYATDDHQRANARALEAAGGAIVLDPGSFDGARLARELVTLGAEPQRLEGMARAAAGLARRDAAARIVDACRALVEG